MWVGEFVNASPSLLLNFSLDLQLISRVPYVLIDRKRDQPNERRGSWCRGEHARSRRRRSQRRGQRRMRKTSLTRRYINKQRGGGSGGKTLLELPILHVTIGDNAAGRAEAATTRPHNDNGSRGNLQFHSLLTMEINRFWAKTLCFATGRPSF